VNNDCVDHFDLRVFEKTCGYSVLLVVVEEGALRLYWFYGSG
jgi:hypothetical protein